VLYGKYCGVWVFIRTHIIIVVQQDKRKETDAMRRRIERLGITVSLVLLFVLFIGCATRSQQSSTPPQVVTVTNQPAWLLIGGKDVSESSGGDVLTIGGKGKGTIFGFVLVSYEPQSAPMTIQLMSGGRIIYWKGKGEITNVKTGERILVPLKK